MSEKRVTRRQAMAVLLGTTAIVAGGFAFKTFRTPPVHTFQADETVAQAPFSYGIASGDPLQERVIIWTRLDPDVVSGGQAEVDWEVVNTDHTATIIRGTFQTNETRDWTVKVDVNGLIPGQRYFYRFSYNGETSQTGHMQTLPVGKVDQARFAIVSCANWQFGYFNVYDHIAQAGHFDALIHLGDYIYEYGQTEVSGKPKDGAVRLHDPDHELVTLQDYRTRMAQYRRDPSLQRVTAAIPLIAVWDDHEVANDSYVEGAENHQQNEGSWLVRRDAALQAYFEWLPVREPAGNRERTYQFRAFEWGDLATFAIAETRLVGRQAPLVIDDHYELLYSEGGAAQFNEMLNDPGRDMLGQEQQDFIAQTFGESKRLGKPWRILANQVVMGRVMTPDLNPHVTQEALDNIRPQWGGIDDFVKLSGFRLPFKTDMWDGYPAARQRLYDAFHEVDVNDILVITGDAHEFWLNDLTDDRGKKMGVEVGTTSVTAGTLKGFLGDATERYALLMTRENDDVRYYNPLYNGYVDLTLKPNHAEVQLMAVDTIRSYAYGAFAAARFNIRPDDGSIKATRPIGLTIEQYALFRGWAT